MSVQPGEKHGLESTPTETQIGHSGNLPGSMRESPLARSESSAPLREDILEAADDMQDMKLTTGELRLVEQYRANNLAGGTDTLAPELAPETDSHLDGSEGGGVIAPARPGGPNDGSSDWSPEAYQPDEKPEKKKSRLGLKIGTTVAGLAVAGGAFFGVKAVADGNNKDNAPTPGPDNQNTAPVTPGPTGGSETQPTTNPEATVGAEKPFTIETVKIPAGLSAKEFGSTLIDDRLTRWGMAGTVPETKKAWLSGGGVDSPNKPLAEKNAQIAAAALFIPGWESNKNLADRAKFEEGANFANINSWVRTYKSQSLNEEAFKEWLKTSSTEQLSGDATTGRVLRVIGNQYNNADKNKIGELSPSSLELNGKAFTFTYTTKVIDGYEYIADVVVGS